MFIFISELYEESVILYNSYKKLYMELKDISKIPKKEKYVIIAHTFTRDTSAMKIRCKIYTRIMVLKKMNKLDYYIVWNLL